MLRHIVIVLGTLVFIAATASGVWAEDRTAAGGSAWKLKACKAKLVKLKALDRDAELNFQKLLVLLRHRDPKVRRLTAYTLGDLRNPRASKALISALQDPDPGVRRLAATGLGKIRAPEAMSALSRLAGAAGEVKRVRRAAFCALAKISKSEARAVVAKSGYPSKYCLFANRGAL